MAEPESHNQKEKMTDRAIIFDLDGTLLDTLQDLAESCNLLRAEKKLPVLASSDYKLLVGNGLDILMRRTLELKTEDDVSCYVQRFKEIYQQRWQRNCCPYPGVDAMLVRLADMRIPLAVLSNKPHAFTALFVDRFLPDAPFARVYGHRQEVAKKPDPAAALAIMDELGCTAGNSFFVGDSGVDMQTAKAAGMYAVGVSWGFRSIGELRENGADMIIDSPLQFVEYVSTLT